MQQYSGERWIKKQDNMDGGMEKLLAEGLVALQLLGFDMSSPELQPVRSFVKASLEAEDVQEVVHFDPRCLELPLTRRDNCNNCTFDNPRHRGRCSQCG